MRLKLNGFLLIVVLLFVVLAACSGEGEDASSENEGGEDKVYKLEMNSTYPPPESSLDWAPVYLSHNKLSELVEERSNGRLQIEIFNSNQLSGQEESLDALSSGTFEMQNNTPSVWAGRVPELNLTALAFWTYGEEHAIHMLRETEVGELFEEALEEENLMPLMYWPSSATAYMSKKPIESPEDLNGLVINTTSSFTNEYYKELGAGIASVSLTEQFEGLMRGTIDAIAFPTYALETYQLGEVVDYITSPPHLITSMSMVSMNKNAFDELPEDLQEVLLEVAQEIEEESIEASEKLSDRGYEYADDNDIEVIKMTEESYVKFKEYNEELVWSKYEDHNDRTKKIIETIREENEKWLENNPDDLDRIESYLAD